MIVFELDLGNETWISYRWHAFGVSRSQVMVRVRTVLGYGNGNTAWVRTQ